MVKISIKSLLLSIVIFVLLASSAYAVGSKLVISDVDVKVGGKTSNNVNNGDRISEEAEPGDSVEVRVKMHNNFTSTENLRIDDISVKATIEGIDDGDDLEEEANEFDLSAGSDKRVTLKFEVPLEVDEDSFDILIEAEGEDRNGTNHDAQMRLILEVDKKSHLLKITRNSLSPAEITCNRKNVQLGVTIVNIGAEDEEYVRVEVSNSDLSIDVKENVGELTAEPNEPESKFSKTYSFRIADDVEAGTYPIELKALYDDERKKAESTVELTVSDCLTTPKTTTTPASEPANAEESVDVVTGRTTSDSSQTTYTTTAPEEDVVVTQESFFKSNAFLAAIIIAEVVAVIIGIVLIVSLFRRRE